MTAEVKSKKSSFIQTYKYFPSTQKLIIKFITGSVWTYDQVDASMYREFCEAPSKGKYFNENIRNSLPCHKLYPHV